MKENCFCPTISDCALYEIERKVGKKVAYIVAYDVEGNSVPLAPEGIKTTEIDFPVKTSALHSVDSAAFGSFAGSCCFFYKIAGNTRAICFEYPGDCPNGSVRV